MPLALFSQQDEKRLALVIGNSNYDKGPLKNPVNDALLMQSTLDSLGFDVILGTNLETKDDFIKTVREFGNKRRDYDVAFVYYAGHGIQVGAENFLLPTKVNFETEFDVMDFGVSVQNIMRYLTSMTNQVNILVLDACRDNPFEGNWNKSRSVKGKGLAKIQPPTGSLIAYSTDVGNTAADGDGENSIYCKTLCQNMLLQDVSLDQIFRNVRTEVLNASGGNQRPVESTQLTGTTFYLRPGNFEKEFKEIKSILISNKNIEKVVEKSNIILSKEKENYKANQSKAHALCLQNKFSQADSIYRALHQINPSDIKNIYSYIIHDDFSISKIGYLGNACEGCSMEQKLNEMTEVIELLNESTNEFNPWVLQVIMKDLLRFNDYIKKFNIDFKFSINGSEIIIDTDNYFKDYLKYTEMLSDYSPELINRSFKESHINKSSFNVNEFFITKQIQTELEYNRQGRGVIEDYEKSIEIIEEYINNFDPELNKLYTSYVLFYVGLSYFNDVKYFERGIEILKKAIENNQTIYVQIDSRYELYNAYRTKGNYELALKYLKEAKDLLPGSSFGIMRIYYDAINLNLSDLSFENRDYVTAFNIFDEITSKDYQVYFTEDIIAFSLYNKYLINLLTGRFKKAEESLKDFMLFCESKDLEVTSEGTFKLIKDQDYYTWSIIKNFSKDEKNNFLTFSKDKSIVLELFSLKDFPKMFGSRNKLFEILTNKVVANNLKKSSTYLNLKETDIINIISELGGFVY